MAQPTGSLRDFMDAWVGLEQTVHPDLRVYRWRPSMMPELPALYNWMTDAPHEVRGTGGLVRDTITLLCRIAIRHTDVDEQMAVIEIFADAFRNVVDTALRFPSQSPLTGIALSADRTGMRTVLDTFNETDVMCIEFSVQAKLDRVL